jgi:hypothetical protein
MRERERERARARVLIYVESLYLSLSSFYLFLWWHHLEKSPKANPSLMLVLNILKKVFLAF